MDFNYPLEKAIELMKQTDVTENSPELYMVRGWLMDNIEKKATPESFDEWIDTDDYSVLKAK
jgi:hypothetical protein